MKVRSTGIEQIARFNHLVIMTQASHLLSLEVSTFLICKEGAIALRQGHLFEQREQLVRGSV